MSRNYFGIDLGTYEIKVYEERTDQVIRYKNAIAIQKIQNRRRVIATGDDAYNMFEKCPPEIKVSFPMDGGVISDLDSMQFLLKNLVWGGKRGAFSDAGYLLAAPSDVTQVEKKTFFDLVIRSDARTRNVRLVPKAIADAVGLHLNVFDAKGIFMLNMGGSTTEYSILSSGGLVINKMEKTGGKQLDQQIAAHIRKEFGFLIGIFEAERLKNELGYAYGDYDASTFIAGRSLMSGLPGEIEINSAEVYASILPYLDAVSETVQNLLDRIPPEMLGFVEKEGLYLTGGVSNIRNVDKYFERKIGMQVHVMPYPEDATISGLREMILNDSYSELSYTMLDRRKI